MLGLFVCDAGTALARRFCGGGPAYQPRASPSVMPELPPRMKSRQNRPYRYPAQGQYGAFAAGQTQQPGRAQRWQKPEPAQQVAQQGALLGDGVAMPIHHADVPGFHRQRLAFGPEPDEIDAKNNKYKGLQGMAVVQRIAGLAQGAEKVACNEDHAKHQHAFIHPASHASGDGGC